MKNKKKNQRSYFIVSLFIVVVSLAVGYAVFAETLNISGTAQATGNFDVEFFTAALDVPNTSGVTGTPTATISGDKNTLTLSQVDLQLPGSKATFDVTVKNVGNVAANLLSVDVVGTGDAEVVVTYPVWPTGVNLAANATYTFEIVVEWLSTSEDTPAGILTYTAALNYQQAL